MTLPFGELIEIPQFLVNNVRSSSDSNVMRRENTWPANEKTKHGAQPPSLGVLLGQAVSDTFTCVYDAF